MVPGPLLASPPETDQATFCVLPPAVTALNCCAGVPWGPVELQPVQLVSIVLAPGGMEKAAFAELADIPPPAQPARTNTAGARTIIRVRDNFGHISSAIRVRPSDHAWLDKRQEAIKLVIGIPKRVPSPENPAARAAPMRQ